MLMELAVILVFPALMIFAGAMDIFTMTIPNRISIALVAGFVFMAPFAGLGWETIALHFALSLAMLIVGVGMFAAGWMGGGDAKLFAAASLWMGVEHIYEYALVSALCGGAITLVFEVVEKPAVRAAMPWNSASSGNWPMPSSTRWTIS